MSRHRYSAYGLVIELPFACSLLAPAAPGRAADVTLSYGPVPRELPRILARNDSGEAGWPWQTGPEGFLVLGGRRAGRFLVQGGKHILLERNPLAEEARIEHLLLHIVLAAVLRQRGHLVLHANAVVIDGRAVAIAGESGAGKSTTLAALHDAGGEVLSDDVTALYQSGNGKLEILPGAPQVYLCEDAALGLGRDIGGLARNPFRRNKVIAPLLRRDQPAPLSALYLLETGDNIALDCEALEGAAKFNALQDCIYGPMLPEEHPALFPLFAELAGRVPVFRLRRPRQAWTVADVVERIRHG